MVLNAQHRLTDLILPTIYDLGILMAILPMGKAGLD